MTEKLGRLPLGVKVFSLALALLALLLAVALFSYGRLRRVGSEVQTLTKTVIPAAGRIDLVDIRALEQKIHLERMLRLYETPPVDTAEADRQRERFEELDREVDAELRKAAEVLRGSAASFDLPRLLHALERIEAEHQEFHDAVAAAVSFARLGQRDESLAKVEQVAQEEKELHQETEAIRRELHEIQREAGLRTREHQEGVLRLSLAVSAAALLLGLVASVLLTRGLTRPVGELTGAMRTVKTGDLAVRIRPRTRDEVGQLARSFSAMIDELVQKEQILATFGKYVDPRVVDHLVAAAAAPGGAGEKQVMTVLFFDVDGLGELTGRLTPEEHVRFVNEYLTLAAAPVSDHLGVIDKFIDTTVMAFWGPPFTSAEEHPRLACAAALRQLERLDEIRRLLPGSAALRLHSGIATGPLVVGSMGSEQSRSYTVLGDTVNTASRLQGVSRQYGAGIVVTEETREALGDDFELRELDLVRVVGKDEPVRIFEVLARRGELGPEREKLRDAFEQGLARFRARAWDDALETFSRCLRIDPSDGPAAAFHERTARLRKDPPDEAWDGVRSLRTK